MAEKKSTRDSLNRRLQLVPKEQRQAAQATAEGVLEDEFRRSRTLRIVAVVAILIVVSWFLLALFQPGLDYKFDQPIGYAPESPEFLRELEALTDARVSARTGVDVLANGEVYYPAELDAIKNAQHSITLEAYIFHKGEMAQKFVDALAAKARTGVHVNIVVDAVGSFSTPKSYFKTIRDAGGQMEWYHPLRWYSIFRSNNRTHRELLVVDGTTAFIGGAGIADHWVISKKKNPRWRDNMYRIHGDAVAGLQGTFVENWLEASGKIISGRDYFPFNPDGGAAPALVVNSSPSSGLSTRARILFQSLVAASRKSLVITTPYFLPDNSLRDELLRARARGVDVRILVPGAKSDHSMTRSSSRSKYGPLLQAGAKIYEYAPAMIHQKLLIADGTWVVVGSTNFDSRSFGLNDEINLATRDTALAARLTADYEQDISQSEQVSYEKWKRRPVWERAQEWFGWIIERQQ